jgi:hypothetical protein
MTHPRRLPCGGARLRARSAVIRCPRCRRAAAAIRCRRFASRDPTAVPR